MSYQSIITCDRCRHGVEASGDNAGTPQGWTSFQVRRTPQQEADKVKRNNHLCPKCTEMALAWIKSGRL